jgi:hypothetical protein
MIGSLGVIGQQEIVFKSGVRWIFEADFPMGKIEPLFVKVSMRPFIPGKEDSNNKSIMTTIYDLNNNQLEGMYKDLPILHSIWQRFV